MGAKFANIQIRESNLSLVEIALKKYLENSEKDKESIGYFLRKQHKTDTFYIGQVNRNWITILHSALEWGNVSQFAYEFSQYYKGVIMAVGYYDDDVLGICIVKDEELLTQHVSGEGADYYAAGEEFGNVDVLIKELNLDTNSDELKNVLQMTELDDKVKKLEKSFNTLLWIKVDWLNNLDEHIRNKFKAIKID